MQRVENNCRPGGEAPNIIGLTDDSRAAQEELYLDVVPGAGSQTPATARGNSGEREADVQYLDVNPGEAGTDEPFYLDVTPGSLALSRSISQRFWTTYFLRFARKRSHAIEETNACPQSRVCVCAWSAVRAKRRRCCLINGHVNVQFNPALMVFTSFGFDIWRVRACVCARDFKRNLIFATTACW
jgi:hypothetical protein